MLRVHAAALRAHVALTGVKGKLWATFIPAEPVSVSPRVQQPRGVSIIARDFQTVALYKADGSFAGIRRPGSNKPIEVSSPMAAPSMRYRLWSCIVGLICACACWGQGLPDLLNVYKMHAWLCLRLRPESLRATMLGG